MNYINWKTVLTAMVATIAADYVYKMAKEKFNL